MGRPKCFMWNFTGLHSLRERKVLKTVSLGYFVIPSLVKVWQRACRFFGTCCAIDVHSSQQVLNLRTLSPFEIFTVWCKEKTACARAINCESQF